MGTLRGSGGPAADRRGHRPLPVPAAHPEVAWRGGVDLNPLDVADPDAMAWLEILVWPEQDERRERLRAAVEVAAPRSARRCAAATSSTTCPRCWTRLRRTARPVVFHSAVIAYLEAPEPRAVPRPDDRARRRRARCRWISNEGRRVLPRVTGGLDVPSGRFVTALDGVPVAFSHGHGHAIDWLS